MTTLSAADLSRDEALQPQSKHVMVAGEWVTQHFIRFRDAKQGWVEIPVSLADRNRQRAGK